MRRRNLELLQQRLGVRFNDLGLLRQALTHPSSNGPGAKSATDNQRLEFLGDSVVGLMLSHALFERLPDRFEGELTKARARLENRASLAEEARKLDLGEHLTLGPSEERQGGRSRESILSDAFEAVVGAIYLDQGYAVAREFLERCLGDSIDVASSATDETNPKGQLQEFLQADSKEAPSYRLDKATGPDHQRHFECSVHHAGRLLGKGQGASKQQAEADAAAWALRRLREESQD